MLRDDDDDEGVAEDDEDLSALGAVFRGAAGAFSCFTFVVLAALLVAFLFGAPANLAESG